MKKVLTVLTLIAVIVFLYSTKNRETKIKPVNLVTLVKEDKNKSGKTNIKKPKNNRSKNSKPIQDANDLIADVDRLIAENSYMALFHDYQLSLSCQKAINRFNYDLLIPRETTLKPIEIFLNQLDSTDTSEIQLAQWSQFVNDCQSLVDDYSALLLETDLTDEEEIASQFDDIWDTGDEDYSDYYDSGKWDLDKSISEQLYKKLQTKQAKTEKEKSLKHTIQLISKYAYLRESTDISQNIKYAIPMSEVYTIKEEISTIETVLDFEIYTVQTEDYQQSRTALRYKKITLTEYLQSNRKIDKQLFNQNKKQFISLHNQLISMLTTATGDEFELIIGTITNGLNALDKFETINPENQEYAVKIRELNQEFYQNNNIRDSQYYNLLIDPVMNMLYCYKGKDCGSESLMMNKLCFGLDNQEPNKQACELNLENFYLQKYLTINQTTDAISLFQYMVNNYAK